MCLQTLEIHDVYECNSIKKHGQSNQIVYVVLVAQHIRRIVQAKFIVNAFAYISYFEFFIYCAVISLVNNAFISFIVRGSIELLHLDYDYYIFEKNYIKLSI